MKLIIRFAVAAVILASVAFPASAQNVAPPLRSAAGCAPRSMAGPPPVDALRLVGAQDFSGRQLFGAGDLVVLSGGRGRGVELGQQFFVRRPTPGRGRGTLGAVSTAGWIRVVAVDDRMAVAHVEFACDGILAGDQLEPYVDLSIPPDADRTDTAGELDFATPGRVLFGDNDRSAGATGDFMVTDVGESRGATPGMRFAIYRDVGVQGLPLAAIGEAIVVFTDAGSSVVRLTRTRDAVYGGDLLIPRRR